MSLRNEPLGRRYRPADAGFFASGALVAEVLRAAGEWLPLPGARDQVRPTLVFRTPDRYKIFLRRVDSSPDRVCGLEEGFE